MKKFGLGFVVFTVLLFVVSSMSYAEEMEGTLEVIMATKISETQKSCKPLYFINTGGKKMQFSMPATAAPPLSPGQKIKISGGWDESDDGKKNFHCRKVTTVATTKFAIKNAADSADSNYLPEQTPVLGAQRTLVLLLRFPKHDTPEWGKKKAENKVFASESTSKYPNDHSDNAYWKECSRGKMWLEGECLDGWKEMPKPATEYGYGSNDELDFFGDLTIDAINTVDAEVDFTQYDRIICIRTGKGWGYAFATRGKGSYETAEGILELSFAFVSELDVELDRDYTTHEFGHELGLVHANGKDVTTGKMYTYGDGWDNRGQSFAQLDVLHRWILGWLDIDQIKIVASSGDYWLDQRELSSGGTKLLVVFTGYDNKGRPILYYLEYFKELGEFDSRVFYDFDPDINKDVVLLRKYKYEDDYDSLVYANIDTSGPKALDIESQEFCNSEHSFCTRVLQKTGTGANSQAEVSVTISTPTPTPTPITKPEPSPTPSPSPTLEPTPSPSPTPALAEMSLEVSLNKAIVWRGGKVKVSVEVKDVDENILQADIISCKMIKSDKSWHSKIKRGASEGNFNFKIGKKDPIGPYKLEITASKEGYDDSVIEKFFKVKSEALAKF